MAIALALAQPVAEPTLRVERLPRLTGRADLVTWRAAALDRTIFGAKRQPVYVRVSTPEAERALAELGARAAPGRWQLVHLDPVQLRGALVAGAGLELRRAPAHRPYLQVSGAEILADKVHLGERLLLGRTGRGVLVGIVDTGLDLTHPAFFRDDGTSRVVAVWDQDAPEGASPKGFGYGRECKAADIGRGVCDLVDPTGHGTHVAGIAAGGRALGGVAPDAEIAVVRSDTFTRLADAVAYLVELAERRKKALVVNLSVGGQYGPHDGRTPLDDYLNELSGRGRILVAAAGNDGGERMHVGVTLREQAQRVGLDNIPWGRPADVIVELWSSATDDVRLGVELWHDGVRLGSADLVADESEFLEATLEHATYSVAVAFGGAWDATHGLARRTVIIDASGAAGLPRSATLALRLEGAGTVHGWLSQSDYRHGLARFAPSRGAGWVAGDGAYSVAVPATAAKVIAVGAYATNDRWIAEDGGEQRLSNVTFGALAAYSSVGPTLAPLFTGHKPNITAPGSVIVSARAAVVQSSPTTLDAARLVMQGTSMAAPHVAGVVALMLEAHPELSSAKAMRLLTETARQDEATGLTPNDAWGAGKIDALAAVERSEGEVTGCAQTRGGPGMALAAALLALGLARRRRRSVALARE